MNQPLGFAVADPEFYAPLETTVARGEVFRPAGVPDGWQGVESGIWTMWFREKLRGVEDGWKVHVSARADRLGPVLDIAARVCFEQDVAFKHLSARLFYWWTHHKHAPRPQAGKFIAAYPRDVEAAERLMEQLDSALAGEQGPRILSDRRYRTSGTVHYRYGAFVPRTRLRADGSRTLLVRDGAGRLVEDRRGVTPRLPDQITDPFRRPAPAPTSADAPAPAPAAASHAFGGFVFESAVRHSNAGGAYLGREEATGRAVFIKEARAHIAFEDDGLDAQARLRGEWETLRVLHEQAPGLAPEPIAYFRQSGHEYLVSELVDGRALNSWMAVNNPLVRVGRTAGQVAAYFERCEGLIAGVEDALARLHACGYLFVDVSPGNVLVAEDDTVRLVDFEAAQRPGASRALIGTPGYAPPRALVGEDLAVHDDYGVSALALLLLGPFHHVVRRNPDALAHLHADISRYGPLPDGLWRRVTKYHTPTGATLSAPGPEAAAPEPASAPAAPVSGFRLPTPGELAAEPARYLADLHRSVGDALLAMADVGHGERMFPTIADGYRTNTLCVAYGAAGVAHALHHAGRPLPEGLLDRLRRQALAQADDLAPGLYVGSAGIAHVLAGQGLLEEARDLLAAADRHPLLAESATVFGGSAGLALGHLALHHHTGDEHHLDRALALARAIPDDDARLTVLLGDNNPTGLVHGRPGIALMFHHLARATGDDRHLQRGLRLLHAELDRESDPREVAMTFPISATDRRDMPYLYAGSAGMLLPVTRYLQATGDERLAAAMPRLLAAMRIPYTAMPGLFQGFAGLGLALTDHAAATGDTDSRCEAQRIARGLFKYALPHPTGTRLLGHGMLRHSADLWSGSAGVLLFLTQLLQPRPDPLFTLDDPATPRPAALPASSSAVRS
ncbi:class III lanthionine synthetase LanKC [Kitasatospora camelliae]|uniref:Class III lanthionine synthetase LanKC n=1 Tax=Kitasatospora camelliae TaxID=3156397 RepID=A0AAU8JRF0_9ACTN